MSLLENLKRRPLYTPVAGNKGISPRARVPKTPAANIQPAIRRLKLPSQIVFMTVHWTVAAVTVGVWTMAAQTIIVTLT